MVPAVLPIDLPVDATKNTQEKGAADKTADKTGDKSAADKTTDKTAADTVKPVVQDEDSKPNGDKEEGDNGEGLARLPVRVQAAGHQAGLLTWPARWECFADVEASTQQSSL